MKLRTWLIDGLIVIIVSAIFIIWYELKERDTVSTASLDPKNFKIYLLTMDRQDQFWHSLDRGAADMSELMGVRYRWVAPETKDTDMQIEQLKDIVSAGASAILIAANDPVRMSGPIEDAKAKGIKIIYVDSPAYEEAIITLSTDNYQAGAAAGKVMISELEAIGIRTGRLGIVSVNKETDSTMKREHGFREVIERDGRYYIGDTKYAHGDPEASEAAAIELITEYNDLVGLFGTNEGSSIGVGNAIKEVNKKLVGIGFDKSEEILELLKNNGLNAVLVQNPYTMGYLGVAEAVAALKGYDTGPDSINTGVSILLRP